MATSRITQLPVCIAIDTAADWIEISQYIGAPFAPYVSKRITPTGLATSIGPIIHVPATNVTGLAPSATIDTTNASNITSGTASPAILPIATASTTGVVMQGSNITIAQDGTLSATPITTGPAAIEFIFDGSGSALTTGYKGALRVPWVGEITSYEFLVYPTATITLDVRKCTYAQYDAGLTHPSSGDSIVASAPPSITAGLKAIDPTLTGWTTGVNPGDWLFFYIIANDSAQLATLSLQINEGV